MKQWRCEDGHVTEGEEQPRACTHLAGRRPHHSCGKPVSPYLSGTVRTPRPIGGQPLTRPVEVVDCEEALEVVRACLEELEYHEREGYTGISVAANDARALLMRAAERDRPRRGTELG